MPLEKTPPNSLRRNFVLGLTVLCCLAFLRMIAGFLDALFLAVVFSGIMHPLYSRLDEKFGGRHSLAASVTLVIAVLIVLTPLTMLLGIVAEQATTVANSAVPWIEKHLQEASADQSRLPSWFPFAKELEPYTESIMAKLAQFAQITGGYLATGLAKLSQGTATFFFEMFIMVYAMYFFIIHGGKLLERGMEYLPLSRTEQREILEVGSSVSRATIKGTMIIGLVQGSLAGLGFAVAGIEAAVFWGALMTVLSILPAVGTAVVWVPAVIYLISSGQVAAGVGLAVWCVVVVSSIDNFLRPVLVGRDTKMPDLLILLGTIGGLAMFGAPGLILGPMLAAVLMSVLAIYRKVFADSLEVEDTTVEPSEE